MVISSRGRCGGSAPRLIASLARQSRRLSPVLLLGGFSRSERLLQILECERQLIGVEPFGPAAEAMALQFLDDSDEALDLATGSSELVGMPLALGQQQSSQSVRIGRELIGASRHSAMESHLGDSSRSTLAPESPCRGLQRRMRRRHPHSTHTRPIKTFEKSRELSRTVRRITPSLIIGHRNDPCSSRLATSTTPVPSQNNSFTRSAAWPGRHG